MVERGALEMDSDGLQATYRESHRTQSQLHFENTKKADGLQAVLPTPCK